MFNKAFVLFVLKLSLLHFLWLWKPTGVGGLHLLHQNLLGYVHTLWNPQGNYRLWNKKAEKIRKSLLVKHNIIKCHIFFIYN